MNRTEELVFRAKDGDKEACEQLITENSGLIWSVVRRFLGRGTETDDLYQLGCIGFLKALEGFDTDYGTQFSTYAVPKIAGEIRRYLRDNGAIKVSRGLKEQASSIKTARNHLIHIFGREPTISELSRHTGFSVEEIAKAELATSNVESIHQVLGDDDFSLESVLSDSDSEEDVLERISLRQAIDTLDVRERMVISLRYYHGLTQQRVSLVLNVSQVQVSRIEKRAIQQLKAYLQK